MSHCERVIREHLIPLQSRYGDRLAIVALSTATEYGARLLRAAVEHYEVGLWLATFVGTLFSAYLTYLEPFVIGASCMWCLTSAVVMALLLLASVAPASHVLSHREVLTSSA